MIHSGEFRPQTPEGSPPSPETLATISSQLYELVTYVPVSQTSYERLLVLPPVTLDREAITIETRESLNAGHTRGFSVDLPRTGEPGEPEHGKLTFTREGRLGLSMVTAVSENGAPPFVEALHFLEAERGKHQVLKPIVAVMRQMSQINAEHGFYGVLFEDNEFTWLWNAIAGALDAEQVPISYRYAHSVQLGKKHVSVAAKDYLPQPKSWPPATAHAAWLISVQDDFQLDHEQVGETWSTSFIDRATIRQMEDSLPPLTPADLLRHPYYVLESSQGEINRGLGPYKVIRALVDPDNFEGVEEFETETAYASSRDAAQVIADGWYRKYRADEAVGRGLTETRAQRAYTAITEVVAYAQEQALKSARNFS